MDRHKSIPADLFQCILYGTKAGLSTFYQGMWDDESMVPAKFFPIGDMVFGKGYEQKHSRVEPGKDPDRMHQDRLTGQ